MFNFVRLRFRTQSNTILLRLPASFLVVESVVFIESSLTTVITITATNSTISITSAADDDIKTEQLIRTFL
jgi:hypothetical protein